MKRILTGGILVFVVFIIGPAVSQRIHAQDEYEAPKTAFVRFYCTVAVGTQDGAKQFTLEGRTEGKGFDAIGNFPPYGVYFFGGGQRDIRRTCSGLEDTAPTCTDPRSGATADRLDFIAEFPNTQQGFDTHLEWFSRMVDGKRSCTKEDVSLPSERTPPPQTTTPPPAITPPSTVTPDQPEQPPAQTTPSPKIPPEQPAKEPQDTEPEVRIGNTIYTPALVDTAPKDDDVQRTTYFGENAPPVDEQGRLQFVVRKLKGTADMQLPDGTWVEVHEGSIIPYGATIFTGYSSKAELEASNYLVVILRSLGEMNVEQFVKDASVYRTNLKLGTGELRFKIEKGDIRTDMRVSTPHWWASISGTDLGVTYDKETGIAIWEIYDGSIQITHAGTGETRTIATTYGEPIKRLLAFQDGASEEQTAIPKSEWQNFAAKQQKTGSGIWAWVLAILSIAGIGYLAYRKKDRILGILK